MIVCPVCGTEPVLDVGYGRLEPPLDGIRIAICRCRRLRVTPDESLFFGNPSSVVPSAIAHSDGSVSVAGPIMRIVRADGPGALSGALEAVIADALAQDVLRT